MMMIVGGHSDLVKDVVVIWGQNLPRKKSSEQLIFIAILWNYPRK